MEGGTKAWNGLKTEGFPEAGTFLPAPGEPVERSLVLACQLKEGSRRFYEGLAQESESRETATLFRELAAAEEHHKARLTGLWKEFGDETSPSGDPEGAAKISDKDLPIEGGVPLESARRWTVGKSPAEILELAIGLEADAYDRYLLMMRSTESEKNRRVFKELAEEEKIHLLNLNQHLRTLSENERHS